MNAVAFAEPAHLERPGHFLAPSRTSSFGLTSIEVVVSFGLLGLLAVVKPEGVDSSGGSTTLQMCSGLDFLQAVMDPPWQAPMWPRHSSFG